MALLKVNPVQLLSVNVNTACVLTLYCFPFNVTESKSTLLSPKVAELSLNEPLIN